jgi:methylated-DNA-protein-cysteine methyltransferase-like protein
MLTKDKIYEITRQIPRGKVATYKQIATLAGNANGARFVGTCMRTNPDAPHTPCHRVVGSDGDFHGYSAGQGIPTKIDMLREEGVKFKNGKIDLSSSQWRVE